MRPRTTTGLGLPAILACTAAYAFMLAAALWAASEPRAAPRDPPRLVEIHPVEVSPAPDGTP